MPDFTVTTFINRSPREVFDFATDPANSARWQSGTKSSSWSSEGAPGVGSTVHTVGRLLGRELVVDAEITEWNPPELWGLKFSTGPMRVDASARFVLKDGGTQLIQHFQGEVGGFFKIAEGLAIKRVKKTIETDGQTLKKLLEAGSRAPDGDGRA